MQDLQVKLTSVRNTLEGKISHPFLAQFIDAPTIDEDKLLLLVSLLDYLELPVEKIEHYAIPTMLLQLALDTHDKVTNEMTGKQNLRHRQLTVLAGIYYSGLYYHLLSKNDDIVMIRLLAEGIEMINDQKIIVYQKEMDSVDKLMDSIKMIEASMFKNVARLLHANTWGEVITHFLFMKRLLTEKSRFQQSKPAVMFDALKKLIFPKQDSDYRTLSQEQQNHLISICDKYISTSKQQLLKAKNKLPILNDVLESKMNELLNQHQHMEKSLVEEG